MRRYVDERAAQQGVAADKAGASDGALQLNASVLQTTENRGGFGHAGLAVSKLKRAIFWQITLLPTYMLVCVGFVCASVFEAAQHGPYTRWFNDHLDAKARRADLIGRPVSRIRSVLGSPDNIMEFWEVIGADGRPAPGAEFVTTYEYYPYPWLPFSKFQVHTTRGIVRGLEKFDD
jgi:hypothetical protein